MPIDGSMTGTGGVVFLWCRGADRDHDAVAEGTVEDATGGKDGTHHHGQRSGERFGHEENRARAREAWWRGALKN